MPVKFQSTLPQGKWLLLHQYQVRHSIFQSTLPQGKWLGCFPFFIACSVFQSTLPQGKWRSPSCRFPFVYADFNPHFRKGSDWRSIFPMLLRGYFNPHFRKGSDLTVTIHGNGRPISIHTSAREVTCSILHKQFICTFQSTLPQGKWPSSSVPVLTTTSISIHTSAREVTVHMDKNNAKTRKFQSTLPQGKWHVVRF